VCICVYTCQCINVCLTDLKISAEGNRRCLLVCVSFRTKKDTLYNTCNSYNYSSVKHRRTSSKQQEEVVQMRRLYPFPVDRENKKHLQTGSAHILHRLQYELDRHALTVARHTGTHVYMFHMYIYIKSRDAR